MPIEKSSPLARRTVAIANEDSLFRGARFPQMDELQKQLRESGFGAISCCQTLCDHLPDPLKTHKGYDGGNFVVIRATKGEPG
ncbi:hypothetical protein LGV61_01525 [Desulfurispirillum indicum]|uniref:hypothetical protein n=1 Tax=Desulfurispirillum indicum TaxID=936456 RepID=UPI001CFAE16B|nr:hypothetical protein [Desulfurispirillum indicum]UCZ56983.1 hypothetical protein LGV61_01525 [Desulfurispirillum indicum]